LMQRYINDGGVLGTAGGGAFAVTAGVLLDVTGSGMGTGAWLSNCMVCC
jgi:hypothetical protein